MLVKIDKKEYEIKKLPLGKYAELMGMLDKIPSLLQGIGALSEDKVLENLPKIIKEAFPELVNIISLGSGIPKETIETFGLTDVARIVKAIFEVNEFEELGKVLGTLPRLKQKPLPQTNSGLKE